MRKEIYPMDYEQYTKTCQTIQKTNNRLLQLFEEDLVKSGLKEKIKIIYRMIQQRSGMWMKC